MAATILIVASLFSPFIMIIALKNVCSRAGKAGPSHVTYVRFGKLRFSNLKFLWPHRMNSAVNYFPALKHGEREAREGGKSVAFFDENGFHYGFVGSLNLSAQSDTEADYDVHAPARIFFPRSVDAQDLFRGTNIFRD